MRISVKSRVFCKVDSIRCLIALTKRQTMNIKMKLPKVGLKQLQGVVIFRKTIKTLRINQIPMRVSGGAHQTA